MKADPTLLDLIRARTPRREDRIPWVATYRAILALPEVER